MQTLVLTFLALSLNSQAPHYLPSETRVALIPVVNASGETWAESKAKQAARGDEELHALFQERDFAVIPDVEVKAAIGTLHLDLSDEEQQKRETLYRIGIAVNADLVAFVVITDVDQRKVTKVFVASTEGKAKMKLWLVDAKQKNPILSAKAIEGASKSGGWIEVGEKGSSRKQLAVANGLRDNTKEFFKPYPVTKKIERSKVN